MQQQQQQEASDGSLGPAALCPAADTNTTAARALQEGEDEGSNFILELDDFADQALVEALVEKVLRGEEALETADGVPVRALVCSAATASGNMEVAEDGEGAGVDDGLPVVGPDGSGGGVGGDGDITIDAGPQPPLVDADNASADGSSSSSSSSSTPPKPRTTKRPRAVSAPVAGGIAAAVIGTFIFAVVVGLRGQLRRRWLARPTGMKVSQAGTNVVSTVSSSPPPAN